MTAQPAQEVSIIAESDVVAARRQIREFALELGFALTDVTRIVTAASELTRNIHVHAGGGVVRWKEARSEGRRGIEIRFEDEGPGIGDPDRALEPGYTSGRGLGMGLSGSKRLMDELVIDSTPGQGTLVVARKWLRR